MSETTRDAREYAERHGVEVINSNDFHLQIDLDVPFEDKPPMSSELNAAWGLLNRDFVAQDKYAHTLRVKSPGGNTHIYVRLREALPHDTRVALQALLGSDPKREILNLMRVHSVRSGEDTVLFETPKTAEKVREFLALTEKAAREDEVVF